MITQSDRDMMKSFIANKDTTVGHPLLGRMCETILAQDKELKDLKSSGDVKIDTWRINRWCTKQLLELMQQKNPDLTFEMMMKSAIADIEKE